MVKIKVQAALVLGLAMLGAWAAEEKPLASFGSGDVITEQDMKDYVSRRIDLSQTTKNAWGVEGAVQEMAETYALMQEGKKRNIPNKSKESRRFDDVYALDVYRVIAPKCEKPENEQAAQQYFNETPQAFVLPIQARVSRVILPIDAQFGDKGASLWLLEQVMAVGQGQQKFSNIAEKAREIYSIDAQGDLGWINLEGDHAIMRALQGAKVGEILGPVRDGDFIYLYQVQQRRESRQLTWDEAKNFAADRAVQFCRKDTNEKIRANLFKEYGITIDRAAIRELFNKNK